MKINVKVIRGDFKELEKQLSKLLNQGYKIETNISIAHDDYLYAVLTKTIKHI